MKWQDNVPIQQMSQQMKNQYNPDCDPPHQQARYTGSLPQVQQQQNIPNIQQQQCHPQGPQGQGVSFLKETNFNNL